MDDELNILPISSYIKNLKPEETEEEIEISPSLDPSSSELSKLKEEMKENKLIGPLVNLAKTLDQAKAIMVFCEAINDKNYKCTISLTAARGRGKSAAIGISAALGIVCGFSSVFVTAPSPENLKTFFSFLFMGLEALGYKDNLHYEIIKSTNPEFANSVVRVNVFKTHH